MKTYKLRRDSKKLIINQIEWLCEYTHQELSKEDIKELYSKNKEQLIEIWEGNVKTAGYPDEKWLQIYY